MTARNDYHPIDGWQIPAEMWGRMCDEIDRLRVDVKALQAVTTHDAAFGDVLAAENDRLRAQLAGGSEHQAICVPIEATKDAEIAELRITVDKLRDACARNDATIRRRTDEIAELRMQLQRHKDASRHDDANIVALNELVGELTRHADAMREQLAEACPFLALTNFKLRDDAAAVIEQYDDFIREA